jgi:GDP-D-mannose dehydratase
MSSVALITGITGQDGSYLAEFLYKVKPHLIIGDTIYRQMKINKGIYTYDEIDKGCSIMDIDNDLFT